jgi:hypothetical protein
MEGDIPKCHPEETLLTEAALRAIAPELMAGSTPNFNLSTGEVLNFKGCQKFWK